MSQSLLTSCAWLVNSATLYCFKMSPSPYWRRFAFRYKSHRRHTFQVGRDVRGKRILYLSVSTSSRKISAAHPGIPDQARSSARPAVKFPHGVRAQAQARTLPSSPLESSHPAVLAASRPKSSIYRRYAASSHLSCKTVW